MFSLEQAYAPIADELAVYRGKFRDALRNEGGLLGQALGHVQRRGGKLMRPALVLLAARGYGRVGEAAYCSAVTLELLHTASLLHDDVVDGSGERRGQSSVNAAYGNRVAVLAGDYILASSLEQAAKTGSMRIVRGISSLGRMLSDGEVRQMENIRAGDISEQSYYEVIRRKTAGFFAACAELGAVSAGAPEAGVDNARRMGEAIGMCFQIRDDIFDYCGGAAIGKPTGSDMREGNLTLPAIYALKAAASPRMLSLAAKVRSGEATDGEIGEIIEFAKESGGIDYAVRVMNRFRCEAGERAAACPDAGVRKALESYIGYAAERDM